MNTDEHPGDTLGKRFLTFWGSLAAIGAFGVAIYATKSLFGPNDGEALDGGSGQARYAKKALVMKEQEAELSKYALDKAKNTVTLPVDEVLPYIAKQLSAQKEEKSKMPVPGAVAPGTTPGTGEHDANKSAFDKL